VLPTDLLALVSYNGRSYKNEAWTRERLGSEASQNTLGLVLDQFLAFARGRSAWISVRRQRLQGLVGARQRGGRSAWEIDYLIDATPDKDAVGGLLECAIAEVGKSGAEKLFLRIESCSEIETVVRSAGFLPYQEEVLYAREQAFLSPGSGQSRNNEQAPAVAMRLVEPADSYALFRLYNAATPEVIRRSEAATFGEWHASQERRWLRHGVQLLAEENGQITAATRAARLPQGILVDFTSNNGPEKAVAVIEAALGALEASNEPIFVIVPASAEGVARRLETSGFRPRQQFVSLVCRTTRPLSLPKLVPAVAKSVGV